MEPAVKKWMPAVAIPAVIAAMGVGVGMSASATPQLPSKSAAQVIELMASSDVQAFSGEFHTTANLGIPALPDAGAPDSFGPPQEAQSAEPGDGPSAGTSGSGSGSGSGNGSSGAGRDAADPGVADLLGLLTGTHQARVYVDGQDKARLQALGEMEEQDVVLNGTSLWTYDSAKNHAVHTTLPQSPSDAAAQLKDHRGGTGVSAPPTPGQLAERFLAAADPTTHVSVEDGSSVAGRDAYTLVLTPKTRSTLVEDVTIGVDAATGVPLAVTVDAVGQDAPALSAEFTSFTPGAPEAKLFDFTPPSGATVQERPFPKRYDAEHGKAGKNHTGKNHTGKDSAGKDGATDHRDWLTGTGWGAIATIPADQVPAALSDSALLGQMATDVEGGKLLHTSLVNILLADDGRVLVGAVPVERLQAAADAG